VTRVFAPLQISGFCTGAALAARGGASTAMKAGMIGGIFLGLIEGLNIAMMKWFSKMDQVPQHDEMQVQLASVSGDEPTKDAAEQPWWAKLISPAPPPPEVDFSDPKEVDLKPEALNPQPV
jgi:hypothetical protein